MFDILLVWYRLWFFAELLKTDLARDFVDGSCVCEIVVKDMFPQGRGCTYKDALLGVT